MSTDIDIAISRPVPLLDVLDEGARVFARLTGILTPPSLRVERFMFDADILGAQGTRPMPSATVIPARVEDALIGGEAPPTSCRIEMDGGGVIGLSTRPSWAWGPRIGLDSWNHAPATYVLMAAVAIALMERWGAVMAEEMPTWFSRHKYPTAAEFFEELHVDNPTGDFDYGVEQVLARTRYRTG